MSILKLEFIIAELVLCLFGPKDLQGACLVLAVAANLCIIQERLIRNRNLIHSLFQIKQPCPRNPAPVRSLIIPARNIKRVVLIDNHLLIADFKVLRIKLDRHSLSEQPCYEA